MPQIDKGFMMSAKRLLKILLAPLKVYYNKLLAIRLSAEINGKDECGRTPLMHAAYDGRTEAVRFLLRNGADVNARDLWDVTAMAMASARGRNEIILLLKEAGATE